MKVLIVEDEPVIALDLEATLTQAGFEVVGPAATVAKALALLETIGCDAGVLDANLNGDSAAPVAEALKARSIPFIAVSGYSREQRPAAFADAPFFSKPFVSAELVAALRALRR
jgi:DNA-binding response OmpR family regulator